MTIAIFCLKNNVFKPKIGILNPILLANLNRDSGVNKNVYVVGYTIVIDTTTSDSTWGLMSASSSQLTLKRNELTWMKFAIIDTNKYGQTVNYKLRFLAQDGSVLAARLYTTTGSIEVAE